jgi:hypothetical protein
MTFQDDLARDGRHETVKRANQQVEARFLEWSQRWLLDGASVKCRGCGEKQRISESGKTFEDQHDLNCQFSKLPSQSPFGQLAEIFSEWHMEIWDEDGNVS